MDLNIIHMSFAKIYRFKGTTFEWHSYCGPIILRRGAESERNYKNISNRIWSHINKFSRLSDEAKELYRII